MTKNFTHFFKAQDANAQNPDKLQFSVSIAGAIQLLLIVGIAVFLMLDMQHLSINLSRLNLAYVGIHLFYLCIKQLRMLSPLSIGVLILSDVIANIVSYENNGILYLNICSALTYALLEVRKSKSANGLSTLGYAPLAVILFALTFNMLHFAANGCACPNEDTWTMWYGSFVVLGIWLLAKFHLPILTTYLRGLLTTLLFIYVFLLAQISSKSAHLTDPFHIFNFSLGYDYRISTFYLAIYASFALIIAAYLFCNASKLLKLAFIIMSLVLLQFILFSSWRPLWLGLMMGSLFILLLVKKRMRFKLILGMVLLQCVLFGSNVGNYADRLIELAQKIRTEERTVIWHDAWQMQSSSTSQQWLYGHGLNSFVVDFKEFSRFHREKNINYRSPHNIFLDVLYASGILGLLLAALVIYHLYLNLIKITHNDRNNATLACAMLVMLTVTIIANGLNHGFFTRISFYPLCFIFGTLIFMHYYNQQQHIHHEK